jgi:hypothetical protein
MELVLAETLLLFGCMGVVAMLLLLLFGTRP